MTADTDEELHHMADRINLSRRYAQHMNDPRQAFHHYDITPSKRLIAIKNGAIPVEECPVMRKYVQQNIFWVKTFEVSKLSW